MFLASLSTSLLQIFDAEHLTYERAAELCGCSSKHLANIVRRYSCPSLKIFEGICVGLQRSPNCLLGFVLDEQLSYRIPLSVAQIHAFPLIPGKPSFALCPKCGGTLEREGMKYCCNCGQCLSWKNLKKASVISICP